jgi:hypothetical protein
MWEDFRRTIFDPIYVPGNVANDQQIAILFLSMAICVLTDPKRTMYHPDARRYYHLSRVSMSLDEVTITLLQMPTQTQSFLGYIPITLSICYTILGKLHIFQVNFVLIQSKQLFSTFNMSIDDPNGPDRAWSALSLAIRLAQMVCSFMAI